MIGEHLGVQHVHLDQTFLALAKIKHKDWITVEAFFRNDLDFGNAINVWRECLNAWDIAVDGYKYIKQMCMKHGLGLFLQ